MQGLNNGDLIVKCRKDCTGTFPNCVPHCGNPCPPNSQCTSPDFCECNLGYTPRITENARLISCERLCDFDCPWHSNCISRNTCKCNENYEEVKGNTYSKSNVGLCRPICNVTCPENSSCTAPNVCKCNTGFKEIRPGRGILKCEGNNTKVLITIRNIIYVLVLFVLITAIIVAIYFIITLAKKKNTDRNGTQYSQNRASYPTQEFLFLRTQ